MKIENFILQKSLLGKLKIKEKLAKCISDKELVSRIYFLKTLKPQKNF